MTRDNRTFGALIAEQARTRGDQLFLLLPGRTVTYREFDDLVTRAARGFQRLGVQHGDRVCLSLPNGLDVLVASFGLMRLGALQVPLSSEYRTAQVGYVIKDADARVIVSSPDFFADHRSAIEPSGLTTLILTPGPALESGELDVHQWSDLLMADTEGGALPQVLPSDALAIIYTSGTTGDPKGVLLCHEHEMTIAENTGTSIGLSSGDCYYNFYPLYHNTGLGIITAAVLFAGARMYLVDRFSKSRFWSDVVSYGCTVFYGMGPIIEILNKDERGLAASEGHRLRVCYGIAIGQTQADRFTKRFGVPFVTAYGATEINMVSMGPLSSEHYGAAGTVHPDFEVAIVDEQDNPLPVGDIGEIVVRPRRPFVTALGYWRKGAATVESWRNLWMHTGDAGRFDEDGYLYFVDRIKDVIRHRGNNVASYEVESVILTLEEVEDVAVIPVPSDLGEFDQEVCAVIVAREGAVVDPASVVAACLRELPRYAVPRYVEFTDELPRTSTGKVRKVELRSTAVARSRWDRLAEGSALATHDAERQGS